MWHKVGTVSMALGTVLVLAALSLFLWNRWEDGRAGVVIEEIQPAVEEYIETAGGEEENAGETSGSDSLEMAVAEIDGYDYIGYISIPALGLDLPVMSSWSYEQLRIAPCRYYGSTKTGNLVIAAHNYSRHFGNIKNLSQGDAVSFTDMEGTVTRYEVDEVFIRERLTQLRRQKHVTEYKMSLDLKHSRSYIHSISTGRFMPSLSEFLAICEYLGVTPGSFFNPENENPALFGHVVEDMQRLDEEDLRFISYIISHIASQKEKRAGSGDGDWKARKKRRRN